MGSLGREDPVVSSFHPGSDMGYAPWFQVNPLHDWIALEVTRPVREELPDIIERVTNRVTSRVQVQTATVQTVDGVVGINQEK